MAIRRIVDAHIHLWDPARVEWYPYLSGRRELGMGDISRMCRRFDEPTYFAESSGWNVEKYVHVAAASAAFSAQETLELDRQAQSTGHPDAIVGAIVPTASMEDTIDLLDRQMASPRLRGVRPMGGNELGALPTAEALRELRDRALVLDVLAHPDALPRAAAAVEGVDGLTVVVEHAGWPRVDTDEEFDLWRGGMAALAAVGERVHCKLSGLATPLQSMQASAYRRWIETCLELFGVDRCLFASNFPVDGNHGTFDELYAAFDALTASLGDDDRDKLFASNAERVYRC